MLGNYLKVALRNLRKYRSYALINVVGLVIGITTAVLILLHVRHELSYDRFHTHSDRIYRVVVDVTDANGNVRKFARVGAPWGPALVREFAEVVKSVRFRYVFNALVTRNDQQIYEDGGLYVDPEIFKVFSFPFIKGDARTALSQPNSLVVTASLAEKYFGARDPVGEVLNIEGSDFVVSAVVENVPDNSHFSFDFLLPFQVHAAARPSWMEMWSRYNYHVYLLLDPESHVSDLQAKLGDFLVRHIGEDEAARKRAILQPLPDIHLHSNRNSEFEANGNIETVFSLAIIAALILLIACINFMNLATARSTKRAREVGLRKVLGAYRKQLIGQFLGEAIIISGVALIISAVVVELTLPVFNTLVQKELEIHYLSDSSFLFGFIGLGFFVGVLSGSYPAFYLSGFHPAAVLKNAFKTGGEAVAMRRILVVIQFAACIVLMIGLAVIWRQIQFIQDKNLGFEAEQVVVIPMRDDAVRRNHDPMKHAFLQNPNVLSIAVSSGSLGGGDWGHSFRPQGAGEDAGIACRMLCIDYDYLTTLGMELASGRNFSKDFPSDFTDAFLLNETAAQQLGWQEPIGQRIEMPGGRQGSIIGIVKDFHFRSLHQSIEPMVMFIQPANANVFSVRVRSGEISAALSFLEKTWRDFAPGRPFVYSFLDERFAAFYEAEERLSAVISIFVIVAVFVACSGLLGLASFTVEQRTKEIGVRRILGASTSALVGLLSSEFLKLVLVANILAWPIAYFATNSWLANFAYRIQPELITFALTGFVALAIAFTAVGFHALKAALSNPVTALRYE